MNNVVPYNLTFLKEYIPNTKQSLLCTLLDMLATMILLHFL